jgi:hypothetical protein
MPNAAFRSNRTGANATFVLQAAGVDGGALPSWLTFHAAAKRLVAPEAVSFSGTDQRNALAVVISATDALGASASMLFNLTVQSAPPSIVRPLTDIAIDHQDYLSSRIGNAFQVNSRSASLTFVATRLPAWASLDPSSGLLTGLPGEAAIETSRDVTVTATEDSGESASATFTLSVLSGCYEGFRYLRIMAFVASADSRLRTCIAGWDDPGGRPFLSYTSAVDGASVDVTAEPATFPGMLGSVMDLGPAGCASPTAFTVGACAAVPTLLIDGLARGADPSDAMAGKYTLYYYSAFISCHSRNISAHDAAPCLLYYAGRFTNELLPRRTFAISKTFFSIFNDKRTVWSQAFLYKVISK